MPTARRARRMRRKEYAALVKSWPVRRKHFNGNCRAWASRWINCAPRATQEATAIAALKRLLNVTVTDAELQAYYTNHPSDFEVPETIHVRHILLMTVDPSTRPPTPLSTNRRHPETQTD